MAIRAVLCCALLALLVGLALPWAVLRLLWLEMQPPGTQARWVHKLKPDWGGSLVRGLPTNYFISDERMDFLEQNFTHTAADVWVVTYQKVGTTWTQYIVTQLMGQPKAGSLFDIIGTGCPMAEVGQGILSVSTDALQRSASAGRPRCFKSHWPRRDFFAKLPPTSKVIYVFRRAEEVAMSYWHHILNIYFYYWMNPEDLPWDTYFAKFIAGDAENGDYFEHVASWWEVRGEPNVLILRYEDLKQDISGTVRRIADFIGADVDDVRVAEVVETTSLKSMKKLKDGWVDRFLDWVGAFRGEHIRKGGEGPTERLVTPAQRDQLVARHNSVLKPIGMPFDYMFDPA